MVRIVPDFWDNYRGFKNREGQEDFAGYQDLIKRCFYHAFAKFPNPAGFDDSYNSLLEKLYSMNIFTKFNPALLKNSNVDKSFEQFVYQWIAKLLCDAYAARRKHLARFKGGNTLSNLSVQTYDQWKHAYRPGWLEHEPPAKMAESVEGKKRRLPPLMDDYGDYYANPSEDCLDAVIAKEAQQRLYKSLSTDLERKIYKLLIEGCNGQMIADACHCSKNFVNIVRTKIRKRLLRELRPACV